jgi:hypothetical protein
MRVLVRRERPHPGAQISLVEAHDGWRYQCVATDTPTGKLAFLEARHRGHAHAEDRVKAVKEHRVDTDDHGRARIRTLLKEAG